MYSGLCSWKKQTSVALSSVEAECMAMCQAAKEAVWLTGLLKDFITDLRTNHLRRQPRRTCACAKPSLPSPVEAHRHSVPLHSGGCPNGSDHRQLHPHKRNDSGCAHQIAPSSWAHRIHGGDGRLQEELAWSWTSTTRGSVRIYRIGWRLLW